MFRIGQQVVCVDAGTGDGIWWEGEELHEGSIYTVRRSFHDFQGEPVLWLDEIARTDYSRAVIGSDEIGYAIERFRPVKETSIDVFTAMLAPTPEKVRA